MYSARNAHASKDVRSGLWSRQMQHDRQRFSEAAQDYPSWRKPSIENTKSLSPERTKHESSQRRPSILTHLLVLLHRSSREAAACESPARKCRDDGRNNSSPL